MQEQKNKSGKTPMLLVGKTSKGRMVKAQSISELRSKIDGLEQAAASQFDALSQDISKDLDTKGPVLSP
jgi:hypothetical protein